MIQIRLEWQLYLAYLSIIVNPWTSPSVQEQVRKQKAIQHLHDDVNFLQLPECFAYFSNSSLYSLIWIAEQLPLLLTYYYYLNTESEKLSYWLALLPQAISLVLYISMGLGSFDLNITKTVYFKNGNPNNFQRKGNQTNICFSHDQGRNILSSLTEKKKFIFKKQSYLNPRSLPEKIVTRSLWGGGVNRTPPLLLSTQFIRLTWNLVHITSFICTFN